MKKVIFILLCSVGTFSFAQTTSDIFQSSEYTYTYLGIDYSHTKFNGDFSQFDGQGSKGVATIKDDYFTGWNNVVNNERDKYSIKDALRKEKIKYDLDAITTLNENASIDEMEDDIVTYTKEDIQGFINDSDYGDIEGIGIMFVGEYLDKSNEDACFHFVIINMETKKILIHERMVSPPGGFGLRNYWIKPVYVALQQVEKKYYKRWKKLFLQK